MDLGDASTDVMTAVSSLVNHCTLLEPDFDLGS
jgi:hypothetical protein